MPYLYLIKISILAFIMLNLNACSLNHEPNQQIQAQNLQLMYVDLVPYLHQHYPFSTTTFFIDLKPKQNTEHIDVNNQLFLALKSQGAKTCVVKDTCQDENNIELTGYKYSNFVDHSTLIAIKTKDLTILRLYSTNNINDPKNKANIIPLSSISYLTHNSNNSNKTKLNKAYPQQNINATPHASFQLDELKKRINLNQDTINTTVTPNYVIASFEEEPVQQSAISPLLNMLKSNEQIKNNNQPPYLF